MIIVLGISTLIFGIGYFAFSSDEANNAASCLAALNNKTNERGI